MPRTLSNMCSKGAGRVDLFVLPAFPVEHVVERGAAVTRLGGPDEGVADLGEQLDLLARRGRRGLLAAPAALGQLVQREDDGEVEHGSGQQERDDRVEEGGVVELDA